MAVRQSEEDYDVVVIGAGFGGMAVALELADRGARVALFEWLKYPGGCASTFERRGRRFESGATLFSGFGEGQLFADWIERYDLDIGFEPLDPIVEMRTETFRLAVPPRRDQLVMRFVALPGVDELAVRRFFAKQKKIADTLWALFDDPALIPPFGAKELLRHAARSPRYLSLLPLLGKPLTAALERWGASEVEPLRTYLNAICQITVQAGVDEAEASFALAAMDYYFRGTGHIHGGIGELAWELVRAFERRGGDLFLTDEVKRLERRDGAWQVTSRRRTVRTRHVVANLLPQAVRNLTADSTARLDRLGEQVEDGWGAAMLYLSIPNDAVERQEAHHLELVSRNAEPFVEGNHVFVSIAGADEEGRAPAGERTVTMSTHIPMRKLLRMSDDEQAVYVAGVQERMRETLRERAPELLHRVELEMTGSPRTFERFTRRPHGYVGGIPRRAGLHNYTDFLPTPVFDNLWLVGDTVFPGQSTLATAIGGVKLARTLQRD